VNLLRAATLTVRDPDATAARYVEWMDYEIVERGALAAELADSWGAPAATGRLFVVCRPASGVEVYLRFVKGEPPADFRPLRTFGWAALEICVEDTLAVERRLRASPFRIIGPPRELDGMPEIFPMQVRGPDDEIVYLTQIRAQPSGARLAAANSLIDRLFILVLAASDLGASARWFAERLGLISHPQAAIRYTMLSKAFDLDPETKHLIATGGHDLDVFLEFDQYPPGALPRPRRAGDLPPGIALVTLSHPDLDTVTAEWLNPPQDRDGLVYGGGRQGVTCAPDGTIIELISSPWRAPGPR
jgi:catechol 2,3-dioxygenase-like lactoylglutathione lyase family enzyme